MSGTCLLSQPLPLALFVTYVIEVFSLQHKNLKAKVNEKYYVGKRHTLLIKKKGKES